VKVSGHVLPTGDRSSSYAQEGVRNVVDIMWDRSFGTGYRVL